MFVLSVITCDMDTLYYFSELLPVTGVHYVLGGRLCLELTDSILVSLLSDRKVFAPTICHPLHTTCSAEFLAWNYCIAHY